MKKIYLKTPEAVIKALKEGKEIRDKVGYLYKTIDGFIVSEIKGLYSIQDRIDIENNPYIIETEPLKFEVGRFYETRNHKKARCYLIGNQHCFFTIDNHARFYTNKRGRCMEEDYMEEEAHRLDIIGPWKEDKK